MPRFAFLVGVLVLPVPLRAAEPTVDFTRDVRPILAKHCANCHGPEKQRGGLRFDRKTDALAGGDSGKAIVPGKPGDSPLIHRIAASDDTKMPPDGDRLTPTQIATLKNWIEQGAKWPDDAPTAKPSDWWSFQPLKKPALAVDELVRAKLKEKGLVPSAQSDRRTLIRRAYFDLIGLPPTPEQVEAFVRNDAPDAWEKLIDELLASPQYGERWARHWLDVVHFGETHGYDKDKPRPNAWPYRDYVIRAFNNDKPYARFLQEQIAGDVLFPGTVDGLEALGFLAAGPWDYIGHAEVPETKIDGKIARHLDRDDFVANTMGTFVGLTVHCAQCHNHKFDPITHEDYYRLQAVFAGIDRTDFAYDTDPAVAAKRSELIAKKGEVTKKSAALLAVASSLASLKTEIAMLDVELAKFESQRRRIYIGAIHNGTGTFAGTGPSGGKPRTINILPRGDVTKPGKEVAPGAIAAIPGPAEFRIPDSQSEGARRAALARWLSDRNNPLTWRVMANRVWQYHFGHGLVDTPNDFGKMGQAPTHPELLDLLAWELRDHQSLKKLHRHIMLSETYRQSSATNEANAKLDIDNRFLWRQNRRKLEAEAVRDSILMVAGKLDLKMGGPSFQDFVIEKPEHSPHYQYHLHDPEDAKSHRRAIYRFVVRSKQQPFMAALDCADPSLAVEKRNQTLAPQQALALLNNRLTLTMAQHFATRVEKLGTNDEERTAVAFALAMGRKPSANELAPLAAYAKEHGLANACRAILNLNEFVFVD